MKYAVFSDIHANLEAYQAFLQDAEKEAIKDYFCVGDIVGYGADPHECIELTRQLGCPVVCGNHDWGVTGKVPVEYFNRYAREAALWTRDTLSDIDKNYLNNLGCVYRDSELTLVHGSLDYPEDFDYILDTAQAAKTIRLQLTPLCFIGHSHAAGIFFDKESGYIEYTSAPEVAMDKERRYLVNAGSIGQPRDGDWRASYCIYDNERDTLCIKRIEYDARKARDKIIKAGLPHQLGDRILQGR